MVAVNAAPGESELFELLDCNPPDGPGEGDLPPGEVPIAEGGGDEPKIEDRSPPEPGLARIVVLVGTRGEGGARLEEDGMGEPAPRMGALGVSSDPSALMVGLDDVELKLDTDPLCPLPLRPRPGVLRLLLLLTSMGDGGEDDEFESI
jgi:hypothetical protein